MGNALTTVSHIPGEAILHEGTLNSFLNNNK
jgi:hypothetical protein